MPPAPQAPSDRSAGEAILLVVDTATLAASAAVVAGPAGVVAPAVRVLGRAAAEVTTHSETLLRLVAEALRQAGLTLAAVDGIGCGAGPGSFTGLRIGLCTAKGLAFATGRPLYLASSLRALALAAAAPAAAAPAAAAPAAAAPAAAASAAAAPAAADSPAAPAGPLVAAVLDAKQGEVYVGLYRGPTALPVGDEVALKPPEVAAHLAALAGGAPLRLCGTGLAAFPAALAAVAGAELLATPVAPDAVEVARLCLAAPAASLAPAAPTYVMNPRLRVGK